MLAVQLRPDVVTEAHEGCPVPVTSERLPTAADTPAREAAVTGRLVVAAGEEEAGQREDLRGRAVPGEVRALLRLPTLAVTFLNTTHQYVSPPGWTVETQDHIIDSQ